MTFPMRRVVRAVVMSLVAMLLIALFHFMRGEPASPLWTQAAGFAVGTLLGDLISQVLGRRSKSAARRRSLRLWAFGFGILGLALFAAIGFLGGAGWSASQFTMAAVFGVVVGSSVGAALAGGWNAAYVGRSRSA